MTDGPWSRMRAALSEATQTLQAADGYASDMARMLRGRLRKVDRYVLVELKRELRAFDAQRKEWKA